MRPDIDLRSYFTTRGTLITMVISLLTIVVFAALGGFVPVMLLDPAVADVEMTVIALSLPLTLILPVVAVVMTAGEWSDRSIQVTLLQRPGRLAVLGSKLLAALMVGAALIAVSIGLAAATTWLGGEVFGDGASFASMDRVWTVQLPLLAITFIFALAMGILTQSTVLGLMAAIGVPFVIGTAGTVAMLTGSEVAMDVVRAVDLQSAAVALGEGEAGLFELLPVALLIVAPAVIGVWRWNRREVG